MTNLKKAVDVGIRDILRVYWGHAKAHLLTIVVVLVLGVFVEVMQSGVVPLLFKRFVNTVSSASGDYASAAHALFVILFFIVLARSLNLLVGMVKDRMNATFQTKMMAALEQGSFYHTLGMSYRFFTDTPAGAHGRKIMRLSGSFENLADIFMLDLWGILFGFVSALWIIATIDPFVSVMIAGWSVFAVCLNVLLIRKRRAFEIERAALDTASGALISDTFSNAINVKLFATRDLESERFRDASDRLYQATRTMWGVGRSASTLRSFMAILLEVFVMAYAIREWSFHRLTIGDLALFQATISSLNGRIGMIGNIIRRLYTASANAKEAVELLKIRPEIKDAARAKPLEVSRGRIDFADVDFSYGHSPVLNQFSLQIRPKEKVAFVGSSGAGKSTVVKLVFRFFDIDRGKITVDGQDISKVTQDSLRRQIALVPQEPVLFHRSLKENIVYGRPDATMEEVVEAAKKAHCHEFISALEHGYDTLVGERGIKLSGGERQRVAIARAILADTPILVLDEATSSLDSESEALIQDALHELMKDKTVIVIAHRLSTIMEMDRIVVMQEGRVIDEGTHDELLGKVGVYQKLWNIQAGGFALQSGHASDHTN